MEIICKILASVLVFFVFSQTAKTVAAELQKCPEQFIPLHGKCYYFGSQQSTWHEAFLHCSNLTSNLLSLESGQESFAIVSYLMSLNVRNRGWWTSGSDEEQEGKWIWNGSKTPIGFSRWCSHQPDNAGNSENCLQLAYVNDEICWNDNRCLSNVQWNSEPLYYICERNFL